MSLILEALRKSEAERRRGLAPDVAMELPPAPASRPRPLAAWLLPALVVAALLVMAGWWTRREPASVASQQAAIETTDPASTAPAPQDMPRIAPKPITPAVVSMPAAEIPAPVVQTPASIAAPPQTPAPASQSNPAATVATMRPAPTQSMPIQPAPARPQPPPTSDISNDTSTLPPIKLSMLMWDEVPSRRFIILNGQRMAEGDRYGGISVLTIERNSVVVEGNGTTARVPLP